MQKFWDIFPWHFPSVNPTSKINVGKNIALRMSNAGFRQALPLATLSRDHRLLFYGLQLSAAMPLWLITDRHCSRVEFNCMRSAAVGKAARLSIYCQDAACRPIIPLRQVRSRSCTNIIINAVSGKLVWKQHKGSRHSQFPTNLNVNFVLSPKSCLCPTTLNSKLWCMIILSCWTETLEQTACAHSQVSIYRPV